MGVEQIALMIPIVALLIPITALCIPIVHSILKSRERQLQLKLQHKQSASGLSEDQMKALRAELAQLRDTATQFAMSQEHTLHRLEQRIANVERKTIGAVDAITVDTKAEPSVQQIIGR